MLTILQPSAYTFQGIDFEWHGLSIYPQPIIFSINEINFYWYGFLISIGIISAYSLVSCLNKKDQTLLNDHQLSSLTLYLTLFGLIGARLYSVVLDWDYYKNNLIDIVKVWQGGMSLHGAIIFGILTLLLYARYCMHQSVDVGLVRLAGRTIPVEHSKKQIKTFWDLADLVAPGIVVTQIFGRFGNYFNQELFGKPTSWFFGIPIDIVNRPELYKSATHFHPAFLYEALWNVLVLIIVLFWRRFKSPGSVFLIYLILYSVGRFFIEFIRIDDTLIVFGMRLPQVISLLIIFVCGIIITVRKFLKSERSTV